MADYRTVTCKVRQVRADSIMIEVPNRQGWHAIPRSLIHGGDEFAINSTWEDAEKTIRVMEWKCEELGLAG